MKTKILILTLVMALSLMTARIVLANGDLEMPRWVLGGGATDSAAGAVRLRATFGQPVVGVVSASASAGDITLGQGFWYGGVVPDGGYDVYLPLIQR